MIRLTGIRLCMVDVSLQYAQARCAFQRVGSESETICLELHEAEEQSESPCRREHGKYRKRQESPGPWTDTCCSDASSSGVVRAAPSTALGTRASLAPRVPVDWSHAAGHHHCLAQTSCEWPAQLNRCQNAIIKGWEVNQALFFIRAFTTFAVFPLIYSIFHTLHVKQGFLGTRDATI